MCKCQHIISIHVNLSLSVAAVAIEILNRNLISSGFFDISNTIPEDIVKLRTYFTVCIYCTWSVGDYVSHFVLSVAQELWLPRQRK